MKIRRALKGFHDLRQMGNRKYEFIMTSSNGNIFRVKVSDEELWCYAWIYAWRNDWLNNREAGDFKRHRTHYDATVMLLDGVGNIPCISTHPYSNRRINVDFDQTSSIRGLLLSVLVLQWRHMSIMES